MEMNKEVYEKLLMRFALELSEVGVTDNMISILKAQLARAPNVAVSTADETTDRFTYRHGGYMIEASRTVTLTVKKCK